MDSFFDGELKELIGTEPDYLLKNPPQPHKREGGKASVDLIEGRKAVIANQIFNHKIPGCVDS